MKILSVPQIREADRFTIECEPISGLNLMERASYAIFERLINLFDKQHEFHVLCGPGNNGGDGLAIARMLSRASYKVTTWVIYNQLEPSEDNRANLSKLQQCEGAIINYVEVLSDFNISVESKKIVLIDALFGSGLNRCLLGLWSDLIHVINQANITKVAVDIPSGLFADQLNNPKDSILKADYTFTFEFPKLTFLFSESAQFIGNWEVVPIGLHPNYIDNLVVKNYYITQQFIQSILQTRANFSHKGSYGHALLIAGSFGMMGSAVLASKSCMRSGVGLLTSHIPGCGYHILQTAVPEVMADVDICETHFSDIDSKNLDRFDAIAVGSGLSRNSECANALKALIQNYKRPMVVDADALNILSENKTWLSFLPANSILTPHQKEFERLAGKASNSEERILQLRDFAVKYQIVILLKGPHTAIAAPNGDVFYNSTGNPGMATAGSGDVLTGIILGLLSQGYSSLNAAILGVYLHGAAGDIATHHSQSQESLIASDIIDYLGIAFQKVKSEQ
jgi:NAD(P)H-hydrate epimerase